MEQNLKLFNVLVKNNHELTELPMPEKENKHDECINSVHCEGDCDNVSQLKRLNSMKQLGNRRSCPQTKSQEQHINKCNKCDFITQNKVQYESHMKYHDERKIKSNEDNRRPCSYLRSRNGCKKGDSCDFDHSDAAQAKPVVKVPKLCKNGEACGWAPRCRYVHPEQGEVIPARSVERRGGDFIQTQGFGTQDVSQQPPGWTSLRPPAVSATPPSTPTRATSQPAEEQERRTRIIQEFLEIVVPNLRCLTEFPNLVKSQHQKC